MNRREREWEIQTNSNVCLSGRKLEVKTFEKWQTEIYKQSGGVKFEKFEKKYDVEKEKI